MFSELIAPKAHGFSFQAKYGFVAFSDPEDFLKAWKEMDGLNASPVSVTFIF